MGFEPTRAEPKGLAVLRLNHSATSPSCKHRIRKYLNMIDVIYEKTLERYVIVTCLNTILDFWIAFRCKFNYPRKASTILFQL